MNGDIQPGKSIDETKIPKLSVVAFNTAEGWARDVSEDVAWDVVRRAAKEGASLPESTRKFTELYIGAEERLRAENGFL